MVEIVDTARINLREQINAALRRGANAALRSNLEVGNRRPNMRRMVEDAEKDGLSATDSLQMMQQGMIEHPDTTSVPAPKSEAVGNEGLEKRNREAIKNEEEQGN